MKNTVIYFFIFIFMLSFGFLEASDGIRDTNKIEELLNIRIEIMNAFLYGEKDLVNLEKQLSNIEAGKLLESDMKILTHIYNNPTEYERTISVNINDVKEFSTADDEIVMLAELEWIVLGYGELAIETELIKDYNISCIYKNNTMYLTDMRFVE